MLFDWEQYLNTKASLEALVEKIKKQKTIFIPDDFRFVIQRDEVEISPIGVPFYIKKEIPLKELRGKTIKFYVYYFKGDRDPDGDGRLIYNIKYLQTIYFKDGKIEGKREYKGVFDDDE